MVAVDGKRCIRCRKSLTNIISVVFCGDCRKNPGPGVVEHVNQIFGLVGTKKRVKK